MNETQKQHLADLVADHVAAHCSADDIESPSMQDIFAYVDRLIDQAKRAAARKENLLRGR